MNIFEHASRHGGKGYKFTSKSQSEKGIMATVLGCIAMISFFVSNFAAFTLKGATPLRMGAVGLLATLYSLVGIVLGGLSLREREVFRLFPVCGTILSTLSFILWIVIILLGTGAI